MLQTKQTPAPTRAGRRLTDEQDAIIATPPTGNLVVQAFAGCGKTTTLAAYGEAWPKQKGLYLAFNAAIASDAKGKFPSNIKTQTAHGHAYGRLGMSAYRDRLIQRLRPEHLDGYGVTITPAARLDGLKTRRAIIKTINNFFIDDTEEVQDRHVASVFDDTVSDVKWVTRKIVERMLDFASGSGKFTHDAYLKKLQLGIGIDPAFEHLLIDEAQDLNPVLVDLARRAARPTIYVGDPWQSIYAFRGAISAMSEVDGPELPLTRSWRFGPEIATIANRILSKSLTPPERQVRGNESKSTVVLPYTGRVKLGPNTLILARTNGRLFESLVQTDRRFHLFGGFQALSAQILSAHALWRGYRSPEYDPLILSFPTWGHLEEQADDDEPDLKRIVRLIATYGDTLPTHIERLRKLHTPNEAEAELIVSTAHKAKGREAQTVVVLDDFATLAELKASLDANKMSMTAYNQEVNLTYVACTRAENQLLLAQSLHDELVAFHQD